MDQKKLEQAARLIIEAVGEDPEREGLVETPRRFAEMVAEQLAYAAVPNEEIARAFDKTFSSPESDMVVVKDISLFSHCEHHIALMYNMKAAVGYIPRGRVIGLSKIARIADAVSKRLQIQERIGADIRDIIERITGAGDVIVLLEGEHSCMTARGDQKTGDAYKDDFRIRTVQDRRGFAQRISFPGEVMDAGSCSWFVSKNKI